MEKQKPELAESIKKIWHSQAFENEEAQLQLQAPENWTLIGTQFLYIYNIKDQKLEFVSDGITNILGYEPEQVTIDLLYEIIHPEDLKKVVYYTKLAADFALIQRNTEPLKGVLQMDYRMKHANGEFVRILRETGLYRKDSKNNVTAIFGLCTDINAIKKSTDIQFNVNVPGFEEYVKNYEQNNAAFH